MINKKCEVILHKFAKILILYKIWNNLMQWVGESALKTKQDVAN